jgi:hypothetical protein
VTPVVRSAKKDGRQVVTIRLVEGPNGEAVVECDVYPVDSMRVNPIRPGPYAFANRREADRFVEETSRALEYLGCDLTA